MNLTDAKSGDKATLKYSRVGDLMELNIQIGSESINVMLGVEKSQFAASGGIQNAEISGDIIEVRKEKSGEQSI